MIAYRDGSSGGMGGNSGGGNSGDAGDKLLFKDLGGGGARNPNAMANLRKLDDSNRCIGAHPGRKKSRPRNKYDDHDHARELKDVGFKGLAVEMIRDVGIALVGGGLEAQDAARWALGDGDYPIDVGMVCLCLDLDPQKLAQAMNAEEILHREVDKIVKMRMKGIKDGTLSEKKGWRFKGGQE